MSWKCFIVERIEKRVTRDDGKVFSCLFRDLKGKEYVGEDRLPVGATWKGQDSHVYGIKLPGGNGINRFCPELECNGHRWTISGQYPRITVHPSIDCKTAHYHGWITDG